MAVCWHAGLSLAAALPTNLYEPRATVSFIKPEIIVNKTSNIQILMCKRKLRSAHLLIHLFVFSQLLLCLQKPLNNLKNWYRFVVGETKMDHLKWFGNHCSRHIS